MFTKIISKKSRQVKYSPVRAALPKELRGVWGKELVVDYAHNYSEEFLINELNTWNKKKNEKGISGYYVGIQKIFIETTAIVKNMRINRAIVVFDKERLQGLLIYEDNNLHIIAISPDNILTRPKRAKAKSLIADLMLKQYLKVSLLKEKNKHPKFIITAGEVVSTNSFKFFRRKNVPVDTWNRDLSKCEDTEDALTEDMINFECCGRRDNRNRFYITAKRALEIIREITTNHNELGLIFYKN
jgi:hypothetical protein